MTQKRVRRWPVVAALCLTLTGAYRAAAQDDVPVIQAIEPAFVCQGCAVQVVGSNLVGPSTEGTRLRLVRDQQTLTVSLRSFSRSLDETRGTPRHTLTFEVPFDAMTGEWQLIVEHDGRVSAPVTFAVGVWVPPTLHAISPEEAAPGQRVILTGGSIPHQAIVELLDSNGRQLSRVETTARPTEVGFMLPKETPEGEILLRIGTRRDGVEWFSQPLPLRVLYVPVPSIDVGLMAPVAPGQWTRLVLDLNSQRIAADRMDVEFHQGGAVVVAGLDPFQQTRIQVPSTLAPGLVTLRARVWRTGRSSPWSQPVEFELLPIPAEAVIHAIMVVRDGEPFTVWNRLDASPPLGARSEDVLLVGADIPFRSPRITMTADVSPNEVLVLSDIEEQEWNIRVVMPDLAAGEWTLRVEPADGDTSHGTGVVIRVEQ